MYAYNFFYKALKEVRSIIKKTKIIPDIINVGGGFPTIYPDCNPEPLKIISMK